MTANINVNRGLLFSQDCATVSKIEEAAPSPAVPQLVPMGTTVGVRFYTDGIIVLGTAPFEGSCGEAKRPFEGVLQSGDIIKKAGGQPVATHGDLARAIAAHTSHPMALEILRGNATYHLEITPQISQETGTAKIGAWVRDSTQGIGTITYYNPETGSFAALGHGVMDVDTRRLMSVRTGQIFETDIVEIKKGKKGDPGELIGEIDEKAVIGVISKNTELGIYGKINAGYDDITACALPAATRCEIQEGPAKIRTDIEGHGVKEYDVYIESINPNPDEQAKSMILRITDQGLITRTNGIVQGMSGSPILQNGRLVGAVTQV